MSSSQQIQFEASTIHDVAAHLFGYFTAIYDHRSALMQVVNSNGLCLFDQDFSEPFLKMYGFYQLSKYAQSIFIKAVADEIVRYADNGKAMPGLVCAEDAKTSRTVVSMLMDVSHMNHPPKDIYCEGAIQKLGSLCMRHPLPAVVFSQEKPVDPVFEVAGTVSALGFQMRMFMSDYSVESMYDGLYVIQGIFHIPVPNEEVGDQWRQVIQNSVRFINKCRLHHQDSKVLIAASW